MEKCFERLLYKHLLIWIDDLLLYAGDVDVYLDKLEELFALMNEFGLKLSAEKSSLFQRSVKWCGKIIDSEGRRLGLTLSGGKRIKRAAAQFQVTFTEEVQTAFEKVKERLASAAMLAHPRPDGVLSVYTDASDEAWSVIVTDVEKWEDAKPVIAQNHRLLHCLSGTFTGSQANWSVIEKEAFAIVAACDKLPHLLLRPAGFRLYCDHKDLIHVFAPDTTMKKHIRAIAVGNETC
ncbi:hypothetical protein PC110_g3002 [Phytophthora cactorum]|uniref:Reverse transcriptase domain-containing protein n=1 Tax=Phytophthora cactorum TaxID=29920 RepID=A0A329SY45_9STRA|nr:hypothetical protein PC110_g3002 [Phytophthora cactorum]